MEFFVILTIVIRWTIYNPEVKLDLESRFVDDRSWDFPKHIHIFVFPINLPKNNCIPYHNIIVRRRTRNSGRWIFL